MSYRSNSLSSFGVYTFAKATQVSELVHLCAKLFATLGSTSISMTLHAIDHNAYLLLLKAAAFRAPKLMTLHAIDHDSHLLLLKAAALQA